MSSKSNYIYFLVKCKSKITVGELKKYVGVQYALPTYSTSYTFCAFLKGLCNFPVYFIFFALRFFQNNILFYISLKRVDSIQGNGILVIDLETLNLCSSLSFTLSIIMFYLDSFKYHA